MFIQTENEPDDTKDDDTKDDDTKDDDTKTDDTKTDPVLTENEPADIATTSDASIPPLIQETPEEQVSSEKEPVAIEVSQENKIEHEMENEEAEAGTAVSTEEIAEIKKPDPSEERNSEVISGDTEKSAGKGNLVIVIAVCSAFCFLFLLLKRIFKKENEQDENEE